MRSLTELEKVRQEVYRKINLRTEKGEFMVAVAMGDCGLAAGARQVMLTFLEEIERLGLEKVRVIQTGCQGNCKLEPVVVVTRQGQPGTTYVHVTQEKARQIAQEHLRDHQVVHAYTLGKENK